MDSAWAKAEKLLGVVFPPGYRQAFGKRTWSFEAAGYVLLAPENCHPLADEAWDHLDLSGRSGLVIGHDVGGNALFLQVGSTGHLDDTVWVMEHETGEEERVAGSLQQLVANPNDPSGLEAEANRLLAHAGLLDEDVSEGLSGEDHGW